MLIGCLVVMMIRCGSGVFQQIWAKSFVDCPRVMTLRSMSAFWTSIDPIKGSSTDQGAGVE